MKKLIIIASLASLAAFVVTSEVLAACPINYLTCEVDHYDGNWINYCCKERTVPDTACQSYQKKMTWCTDMTWTWTNQTVGWQTAMTCGADNLCY